MRRAAVIFDLDGTILDTIDDLADAVNFALGEQGLPQRDLAQTRQAVGHGIRTLIQDSVPVGTDPAVVDATFSSFKSHYAEHCLDKTVPYEGIRPLLENLRHDGIKIAVVSNKNDFAVQKIVDHWFGGLFDEVLGETEGICRKPAPDAVNRVLADLSVPAHDAVYVGDSDVDVETAANAHMDCIIVSWGYRDLETLRGTGATTIVQTVGALEGQLS